MVVGVGAADLVQLRDQRRRVFGQAGQRHHLVECALGPALHGCAIVADHPDHHRVVGLADLFQGIEQPPDLVVGLGGEPGERLHQPRRHLLLVRRQRIVRGDLLGPGRELRVLRDHAERELPAEAFLAVLVPPLIELTLELVDPLLGRVVGRVRGAGRVVDEERAIGRHRLLLVDVLDGAVGERFVERVVSFPPGRDLQLDRPRVLVKRGLPLVRLAADETVEVVEPLAVRPPVEWPRHAGLPVRDIVVLAEEGGAVTVLAQHLRAHRAALGDLAGVAGEAVAELGDDPGSAAVVVAPGQQRRARRGAEGRRVETGVAQARLRQPVEVGRGDLSAERRPLSEAAIVDDDEQHVRRAVRCLCDRKRPHLRVLVGRTDDAVELWIWWRQDHVPARRRGVGRSLDDRQAVAVASLLSPIPVAVVLTHGVERGHAHRSRGAAAGVCGSALRSRQSPRTLQFAADRSFGDRSFAAMNPQLRRTATSGIAASLR